MACLNDIVFNKIYLECEEAAPLAPFSSSILWTLLERFSYEKRKEIVSRTKDGCAPLFVASKNGKVEIVNFLILYCGADIEQRGIYITDLPIIKFEKFSVTPLWCASARGKLDVVKHLLDRGANVNSASNFASTPVQFSYLITPYQIQAPFSFHDADILKPISNGVTCLMKSVQSAPLCEYLIAHGAVVNAEDANGQTALHYAIQRGNFRTTTLLLEKGADPLIKSRNGDDALQTACLVCAPHVFGYLCERYRYSNERIAEAYELMGSSCMFYHGISDVKRHWQTALVIRYNNPHERYAKKCLPRDMPYNAVEFTTVEELDNLVLDQDAFRIQSLLVTERILGPLHPNMHIFLIVCSSKIMGNQFLKGLDLWRYTLDLVIQKNGLLHIDTYFMAQKLSLFFLELQQKHISGLLNEKIQFVDVSDFIKLLVDGLKKTFKIPLLKYQLVNLDKILKLVTRLFLILSFIPESSQEVTCMKNLFGNVLRMDARSSTGESILHLVVSKGRVRGQTKVIELLLECGAHVDAVDDNLCTPLHVASLPKNFNPVVIKLLLEYGAHVDRRNSTGEWPQYLLQSISECPGKHLQYVTLKCLAARKVVEEKMLYIGKVPKELEEFIRIH